MFEVVANSITCEFEKEIDAINAFIMALGMIVDDLDINALEKKINNSFRSNQIYEFNYYMSIRDCT